MSVSCSQVSSDSTHSGHSRGLTLRRLVRSDGGHIPPCPGEPHEAARARMKNSWLFWGGWNYSRAKLVKGFPGLWRQAQSQDKDPRQHRRMIRGSPEQAWVVLCANFCYSCRECILAFFYPILQANRCLHLLSAGSICSTWIHFDTNATAKRESAFFECRQVSTIPLVACESLPQ